MSLQIRRAYQLDGLVPVDYEKQRYGQIDVNALAQAKEALAQAKKICGAGLPAAMPVSRPRLKTK
ncbi:hypothetical protein ACFS07_28515 [Undibacterium arcticum]